MREYKSLALHCFAAKSCSNFIYFRWQTSTTSLTCWPPSLAHSGPFFRTAMKSFRVFSPTIIWTFFFSLCYIVTCRSRLETWSVGHYYIASSLFHDDKTPLTNHQANRRLYYYIYIYIIHFTLVRQNGDVWSAVKLAIFIIYIYNTRRVFLKIV